MQIDVPITYVVEHKFKEDKVKEFRHGKMVAFSTKDEAQSFINKNTGILIHDMSGIYYALPNDMQGFSGTIGYNKDQ